jgi:hypothetical protein
MCPLFAADLSVPASSSILGTGRPRKSALRPLYQPSQKGWLASSGVRQRKPPPPLLLLLSQGTTWGPKGRAAYCWKSAG